MSILQRAGRGASALHNLFSYPLRYRRLGLSWRDGWTAFMLRLAATGKGKALLGPKECSLHLKVLPTPLTLRRTNSDIFVVRDVFDELERWYPPVQEKLIRRGRAVLRAS